MPTSPEPPLPASSPAFTRRGVVRTAAWSVPVITLVSAAPAFAISGVGEIDLNSSDEAFWNRVEPAGSRGNGSALFGGLWMESLTPDEPTPALVMTFTFPGSWPANVSMAYGKDLTEWGGGWVSSVPVGAGGLVISSNRTLTFTHPGGVEGADPFLDFRYSAWVEGISLVSKLDPLLVSINVLNAPGWEITGGAARSIPVALGSADPGVG